MSLDPLTPGDVVRELYSALTAGDVPRLLERLHPDLVVDEPSALPYGGVHQGRDVFMEKVFGAMVAHAEIQVDKTEVFESGEGVVGIITGTFVARTTGERLAMTVIERHQVEGNTVRRLDIFMKNPEALAEFYERAGVPSLPLGQDE